MTSVVRAISSETNVSGRNYLIMKVEISNKMAELQILSNVLDSLIDNLNVVIETLKGF